MREEIEQIDVKTWEAFEEKVKELRKKLSSAETSEPPLLFRGQEDFRWPLSTTLERQQQGPLLIKDYYRLICVVKPQIESFTGKEWSIPTYEEVERLLSEYDEFSRRLTFGPRPEYPYMVYLRHHGFPSPLLDWTRSSHIAAYFAFSKAASDTGDGKVSIYVFSEARFRLRSNQEPMIFRLGPYVRTHRRHFLQQCEYTQCVRFEDGWRFEPYQEVLRSRHDDQGTFWKFNIPSTERLKVLKLLDEYNLNALSLVGTEESLVETLALREFQLRKCV